MTVNSSMMQTSKRINTGTLKVNCGGKVDPVLGSNPQQLDHKNADLSTEIFYPYTLNSFL
ncbi:hypothetical protein DPMN_076076 [Dreissena polymorpha]|uniref:Uncharacterized protein n=1 Tax=Dreissena polymorpha TaxID=45954 RepID=A0A9D3YI33_DREPO|nr:hypothetical protein DPMN_076076 [Dreissena polymorpha]